VPSSVSVRAYPIVDAYPIRTGAMPGCGCHGRVHHDLEVIAMMNILYIIYPIIYCQ
jgi:hypothetical protein